MRVTTDICCGSGILHASGPALVEVEVIAFSKSPRYVFFEMGPDEAAHKPKIVLLPDSRFLGGGFDKIGDATIWHRRLETNCDEQSVAWQRVDKALVTYSDQSISFELDVPAGVRVQVSTEPPRPYPETVLMLESIVKHHPDIAQLHVLGRSIEGRPIFLLRVTDNVRLKGAPGCEDCPVLLFTAGEHATEFAGEEVTRGMLQAALASDGQGRLRRRSCVMDFVLTCNPDGNVNGWHQYNATDWKNHDYAPGVDRSWHHEFGSYLSGTAACVSPETRAVADWITTTSPRFVHTADSWESKGDHMGVYRSSADESDVELVRVMASLDEAAASAAAAHGINLVFRPLGGMSKGHLPHYLVVEKGIPSCSVEAHPAHDRAALASFGADLFAGWVNVVLASLGRNKSQPMVGS